MKSGSRICLALILGAVVVLTLTTAPAVQAEEFDNWFKIVRTPDGVMLLPGDLFSYVVYGDGDHDPVPPPPPPKGGGDEDDGEHDPVPPPPPPKSGGDDGDHDPVPPPPPPGG